LGKREWLFFGDRGSGKNSMRIESCITEINLFRFIQELVFTTEACHGVIGIRPIQVHSRPAPGPGKLLLPSAFSPPVHAAPALSHTWWQLRDRRRPTPGAEVSAGPFAGDERALTGTRTPSPTFLLCETEFPNPNLSYLSYLYVLGSDSDLITCLYMCCAYQLREFVSGVPIFLSYWTNHCEKFVSWISFWLFPLASRIVLLWGDASGCVWEEELFFFPGLSIVCQ
jgi:hypothetical protein